MHVYKITHKDSGRVYIGLTTDVRKRWRRLVSEALRIDSKERKITRAIREHGVDQFEIEVIETVQDLKQAIEREIYWIAKFRAAKAGVYNETYGGEGAFSAEHRAKMSETHRGKKPSAKNRAALLAARLGKPLSAEHRAKIGAANRGRKLSAEHRAKIGAAGRGKKLSAEHRAKLRAANLGKKLSAERRAKLLASHLGKKHSAEMRAKLSAARRAYLERINKTGEEA